MMNYIEFYCNNSPPAKSRTTIYFIILRLYDLPLTYPGQVFVTVLAGHDGKRRLY